jgi:endogenous inhibitor of DNA gyrase (YacG/DUF329 family)
MDELIRGVAQKLGLEEAVVKKSFGAILAFCKEQCKDIDFNHLLADLGSTAQALLQDAEVSDENNNAPRSSVGSSNSSAESSSNTSRSSSGPTGIFGIIFAVLKALGVIQMLKNLLQPIFGESAVKLIDSVEDGAELAVVLEKLGISRAQGVQMVKMLLDFLKDNVASPETVQKITQQVPAIKVFLGEAKKDE